MLLVSCCCIGTQRVDMEHYSHIKDKDDTPMTNDGFCLLDTMILNPHVQGTWLHVPIEPEIVLDTPVLCVFQNNMNEPLHAQTKRVLKSLLLGIPGEASQFVKAVTDLESFMRAGVSCLWTQWGLTGLFENRKLVALVRPSSTSMATYPHEMRVNMLVSRSTGTVSVVDETGQDCKTEDVEAGSYACARLRVSGIWCSNTHWGLKYTLEKITWMRALGILS